MRHITDTLKVSIRTPILWIKKMRSKAVQHHVWVTDSEEENWDENLGMLHSEVLSPFPSHL